MFLSLLMTFIGYSFINRFFSEESTTSKIALGFLLGYGLVTLPIFFLTYFYIRLSFGIVVSYLILLSLLSAALLLTKKKRFKKGPVLNIINYWRKLNKSQKILLLITSLIITISFVINGYWPVTTWDAVTLYDFRARLYINGGLLLDLWDHIQHDPAQLSYYYSYPPISSVAHAIGYFIGESRIMILYSSFYLALILLFFSNVVKKTSLTMSLFLTFFLATNYTIFFHSMIAYTNLPYVVYIMALFFSLLKYTETMDRRYYFLAIFFSMMSISMRFLEPFYVIIGILLLLHWKKSKIFIFDFLFFVAVSYVFKRILGLHFTRDVLFLTGQSIPLQALSKKDILLSFINFERIKEVLIYLFNSTKNYHFYLLLFLSTVAIFAKSAKKHLAIPVIIFLSIAILIPGTLVLSTYYEGWNRIGDSVNRLMIFFYPLILYFIANIPEVEESIKLFVTNIFKRNRV